MAALAALTALTAPVAGAQTGARLPQRNLLVEVRQGDAASFEADAGLRSGVLTVDADGVARGQAGVQFETRSGDAGATAVTQLCVLNGAQGMLSLGMSVPVLWFEVALGAGGQSTVVGQRLQETGRRVAVRPSWPGGTAPVTVEVQSETSAPASGGPRAPSAFDGQPAPDGAVDSVGLLTTLRLPLGVWTTVAGEATRDVRQGTRRERGVVSSNDATRERRHVVQMRISAL